ncbi:SDR family oxidoreductase (plasmid) [Bosea sp. F3-2]|uniref:SDR family oxidoreductase n=1 Tax=Bosea sp. F3-2 TaxID=2599640 RepID=UPI0011ED93CB|nr:SDR family oxidoreductase [Bosea sp. F3-2]QEL27314.1 SDR family oxidoreductase [Bosea sp. F3-2]
MFALQSALKDRVAVVTGGSGILCGAMAVELARHGVKIAILNRTLEKGESVARRITKAGGIAKAFACNVVDEASVRRAAEEVEAAFGPCTILINGAGGGHPKGNTTREVLDPAELGNKELTSFFDITKEGFNFVMDLNLIGSWIPSQVFGRGMLNRQGATIINISSMAAPKPATKVPAYSAAKAAIDNVTKWMAVHLAEVGIRVNAIAPGFFLTDQNRALLTTPDGGLTDRSRKIIGHTPMRRFGNPEDLLGTMLWLVDEERSGFVTGITVPVDGGFMAYSGV